MYSANPLARAKIINGPVGAKTSAFATTLWSFSEEDHPTLPGILPETTDPCPSHRTCLPVAVGWDWSSHPGLGSVEIRG